MAATATAPMQIARVQPKFTDVGIWDLTKFIWKVGFAFILVWAIPVFVLFLIGSALTASHSH